MDAWAEKTTALQRVVGRGRRVAAVAAVVAALATTSGAVASTATGTFTVTALGVYASLITVPVLPIPTSGVTARAPPPSSMAALFVIRYVPETKGRSLEAIQDLWGKGARDTETAAARGGAR